MSHAISTAAEHQAARSTAQTHLHSEPVKVGDAVLLEVLQAAAARRRPLRCVLHLAAGALMQRCLQTESPHSTGFIHHVSGLAHCHAP